MHEVTIVGGGVAGLIAAVECAEAGVPVRVLEAHGHLGGRAVSTPGPFVANLGPHALYTGTALWDWLVARGLHAPAATPGVRASRFRRGGDLTRVPPPALLRAVRLGREVRRGRVAAPVDTSLRDWLLGRGWPDRDVADLSGLAGVLTFDHDPGRLSAAFVWERVERIALRPRPVARYPEGGWAAIVRRLADAAVERGARIEVGARVDDVGALAARGGPVVLAVAPRAARTLLGDDALRPESPRVALLDVGLASRRGDPYPVLDADEAMFLTRPSAVVEVAPAGHSLVQLSAPMRPGEQLEEAVGRMEALLDAAFRGWRGREVWRRRSAVTESTGAVDLPGTTWRDRTPVAYADGVWLAGDWVAAPGHLAEASCTSAVAAARAAVAASTGRDASPAGPLTTTPLPAA
jgi:phytoene dehydrogenase-like protein